MSTNSIDLNQVMAIDGGLRYILHRYPQASGCETDSRKRFKIRETEKSASASLKQLADGKWGVTDFGGDGKLKNAIQITIEEDSVDFRTALMTVAAFYDVAGAKVEAARPDYNSWPAKPDEQEGKTYYQTKELTASEAKTVLVEAAWRCLHKDDDSKRLAAANTLFTYYHLKSVEWKRFTSKGVTHEFRSNERYPIFIYEEGTDQERWGRFYEPKAEKKDRFRYFGDKPKVFIHGFSQAQLKYDESNQVPKDYEKMTDEEKAKARAEQKIPAIIICSGGSDALNTAAMGYQVVWRNSESEEWTGVQFNALKKICEFVYNLPDIDTTGIAQGHKLALQFLDLKTIWLPERMLDVRDCQGKPMNKDLRDFLRYPREDGRGTYRRSDFEELVKTALPYEFWDVDIQRNKEGKAKMKYGRVMLEYKPNNLRIYNFLYRMGFCRLKTDKTKEGYMYVHVQNNIVREIDPSEMEDFIHTFLESRNYTEDLRNSFYRSPQLNSSSLAKIRYMDMDFKAYGIDYQYMFFNNVTWKVSASGVEELAPGASGKYVWEDKILKLESLVNGKVRQYKAKLENDFFKAEQLPSGEWKMEIRRDDCIYLNFLIQTCRMFWREELEERLEFFENFDTAEKQKAYMENHTFAQEQLLALEAYAKEEASREQYRKENHVNISGPLLTAEEKSLQQAHLANRIYVIGYALHRWKFSSRPWAVWAMDNKISDEGESHGGSGKSLVTRGVETMLRVVTLPSRADKMTDNNFLFENVTADTDLILVDDAHQHLDFGPFYAPTSSTFVINRKNMKSIQLPFTESGKFWFNSNYGDKQTDPSTQRRKIHTLFSDYYHNNQNGFYRQERSPKDDFGIDLFDGFDEKQQNLFYNLMAQCLKFYLACEAAVRAPGENVNKRNLMAIMGDNFKAWADVYFSNEASRLDVETIRDDAQEAYFKNNTKTTPQNFQKKLVAWCKLYGYILNPVDKCTTTDKKRIIKRINGETKEVFFIDTSGLTGIPKAEIPQSGQLNLPIKDDDEEMPF